MLLNVVLVVLTVGIYAILGSIVLAAVPKLRITALNLIVFVLGAYVGALLIPMIPYGPFTLFNWPGAVLAGTVAVFLKTLLIKTQAESRWL
jgi:hypothetical protein